MCEKRTRSFGANRFLGCMRQLFTKQGLLLAPCTPDAHILGLTNISSLAFELISLGEEERFVVVGRVVGD